MGGVDLKDMMCGIYEDKRKTKNMWKRVAINIFHRMLLNAYILYKYNTDENQLISRYEFIVCIIESLENEHRQHRDRGGVDRTENAMPHVTLQRLPGNLNYRDGSGVSQGRDSMGSALHFGPTYPYDPYQKAHREKFYLILNVAVGGIGYFPDSWRNTPNTKPWSDGSAYIARDFWNAKNQWYPTWNPNTNGGEDAALQVNYIKVWKMKA
ncbi:unnamed protein product [Mytilus coruscus]|uniref:Uncharacterized protein n=1 Tax=Mytilus coruscus TaxID=42192 RepID=A0A6J8ESF9_MYTCO|nr:unnamed protein product [Mytilus coruscus]